MERNDMYNVRKFMTFTYFDQYGKVWLYLEDISFSETTPPPNDIHTEFQLFRILYVDVDTKKMESICFCAMATSVMMGWKWGGGGRRLSGTCFDG